MSPKEQVVGKGPRLMDAPGELPPEPPLSSRLAFVVQFRVGAGRDSDYFAGRAEHLVTGRVTHFQTQEELWAFMVQILAEAQGL